MVVAPLLLRNLARSLVAVRKLATVLRLESDELAAVFALMAFLPAVVAASIDKLLLWPEST